jgi:hypothetical protein
MTKLRNPYAWADFIRALPAEVGVRDEELIHLVKDGDEDGIVSLFKRRVEDAQRDVQDFRQTYPDLERRWLQSSGREQRLWERIQEALANGDEKLADRLEADLMEYERTRQPRDGDVEADWYGDELRGGEALVRWWRRIHHRAVLLRQRK